MLPIPRATQALRRVILYLKIPGHGMSLHVEHYYSLYCGSVWIPKISVNERIASLHCSWVQGWPYPYLATHL